MATTTYFGWETPDDTDLVKDGAAAIRTLGSAIDSSMSQLEGGTTGQILSKTSATDMAFTWIANDQGDITAVTAGTGISGGGTSGAVTVTNSMATAIDAKGDLVVGTGADAFSRLAVGATNGQVLTVDSAEATGLKYATPTATAKSYSLLGTGTTTSGSTVTVSSISGISSIYVLIVGVSTDTASSTISLRINTDTGANYASYGVRLVPTATYALSNADIWTLTGTDRLRLSQNNEAASTVSGLVSIDGCNSSGLKLLTVIAGSTPGATNATQNAYGGSYSGSSTVSSISLNTSSGSFDAGSFLVYGSA